MNNVSGLLALVFLFNVSKASHADNWPAWRGQSGQGFCEETKVPLKWSDTENVKWKVALEHQGNSTPVVWGERIFLTQANKDGRVRSLLCLARSDGKLLWQQDISYEDKERNWNANWYCNADRACCSRLNGSLCGRAQRCHSGVLCAT
jgi:hypothetical protein